MGAFAVPLATAAFSYGLSKLGGDKPSTDQSNPATKSMQGLQGGIEQFLLGQFNGTGSNPFGNMTSDLQRQATGGMMQFMNANPEQQTLDMLSPGLMDIFGGGSADGIGEAALPVFERQLQASLGGLSSSAPGRFGTAFANQGIGLAQRSAQDFALLQAQARQQEMGQRLGAAGLLGTLSGQAGMNPFQRFLGAGQMGMDQTNQQINPMLQLLLGGMGYARPQGMDTVVGPSMMDTLSSGALTGGLLQQLFGGGGGGSSNPAFSSWADAWNSGGAR